MSESWGQDHWDLVDGNFDDYCSDCNGEGWQVCFVCGGDYPEVELCNCCHGDGEIECEYCNGTGEEQ